jgi:hypothetical protein
MTPKKKAIELYEKMRTHVAESDLHIPQWISETPEIDYPIEEKRVAKFCALVAVDELFFHLNPSVTEFWREVKQEIENL